MYIIYVVLNMDTYRVSEVCIPRLMGWRENLCVEDNSNKKNGDKPSQRFKLFYIKDCVKTQSVQYNIYTWPHAATSLERWKKNNLML